MYPVAQVIEKLEPYVVLPEPFAYPVPGTGVPQLMIVQPDCADHEPFAWQLNTAAVPLYPVAQVIEHVEPYVVEDALPTT